MPNGFSASDSKKVFLNLAYSFLLLNFLINGLCNSSASL